VALRVFCFSVVSRREEVKCEFCRLFGGFRESGLFSKVIDKDFEICRMRALLNRRWIPAVWEEGSEAVLKNNFSKLLDRRSEVDHNLASLLLTTKRSF
jgi:hypothetical protein